MEDTVVFLTQKVSISENFFIISYKQEMVAQVSFAENQQMKINSLNKPKKHGYLIHTSLDNAFKDNVVKRAFNVLSIYLSIYYDTFATSRVHKHPIFRQSR